MIKHLKDSHDCDKQIMLTLKDSLAELSQLLRQKDNKNTEL